MSKLYYTPPTEEQFEDLKECAIFIWKKYDDTHGYASGKINSIKDLKNIRDNFMYMVAMFDMNNQAKLSVLLEEETRLAVRERLIDGGQLPEYIMF